MSGINKVILIGHLGHDLEIRHFPNGGSVCNATLATSESWKDKNTGERSTSTEWHKIVFKNKLAEIATQYLTKGSFIYIEGKLATRKWQNQQGQDQYTTEINVRDMQMLDSKQAEQKPAQQQQRQQGQSNSQGFAGNGQQYGQQASPQYQSGFNQQPNPNQVQKVNPQEPVIDFDDDIPFN